MATNSTDPSASFFSTFFGTVWSIVSGFFSVVFNLVLPTVLALAITVLVIFGIFVIIVLIGHGLGWIDINMSSSEKKGNSSSKDGKAGSDEVLIDVADEKKRVEFEIEFLEELLRARREKLEKFS